ncbi:hypothetical protein [Gluconobacter cerinus]|uniref:hypothetical protein n=1 Tax=Gluconobacter cerinus TaxID=38307 RepID=UPI003AB88735
MKNSVEIKFSREEKSKLLVLSVKRGPEADGTTKAYEREDGRWDVDRGPSGISENLITVNSQLEAQSILLWEATNSFYEKKKDGLRLPRA